MTPLAERLLAKHESAQELCARITREANEAARMGNLKRQLAGKRAFSGPVKGHFQHPRIQGGTGWPLEDLKLCPRLHPRVWISGV